MRNVIRALETEIQNLREKLQVKERRINDAFEEYERLSEIFNRESERLDQATLDLQEAVQRRAEAENRVNELEKN